LGTDEAVRKNQPLTFVINPHPVSYTVLYPGIDENDHHPFVAGRLGVF
jgi:hypothetical protein